MNYKEFYEEVWDCRNIHPDEVCEECHGVGIKVYGSTSTWRSGIGGQVMTSDVCNECWGSGNKYKSWPDWRVIDWEEQKRVAAIKEEIKRKKDARK